MSANHSHLLSLIGTYVNSEALSELNVHPCSYFSVWEAASNSFSLSPVALVGNHSIRQEEQDCFRQVGKQRGEKPARVAHPSRLWL